ncbi:MAG: hypothetical protein IPM18_15235 [Phycisphaerales bacterium]|nr:hypothetical protein [Phycisphaerales bacterium]
MRTYFATAVLLLIWIGTGCASNSIVGHAGQHKGRFNGDVGISGNGNTVIIEKGSNVPKLSVVGDASTVFVEDGAVVWKIEFFGNGNTVSIVEDLDVSVAALGTNKVVRRPPGVAAPTPPLGPDGTPE